MVCDGSLTLADCHLQANLILNVDGAIAVALVDLLRSCGAFTKEEADEHIVNGCLNGLFVLGRSIGFIGHFLDQRRLKQGLYRYGLGGRWGLHVAFVSRCWFCFGLQAPVG